MNIAHASLDDITGGGSGGGSASEPGTLATLALGLGALGLFYQRRRNGLA